ncbi:hypothetical protein FGRMN_9011 [Fusarium graminum]|nr:hypothetical protein FGRMN_9011 [Fusarium graminum]
MSAAPPALGKLATVPESQHSGPPQVISVGLWRMVAISMVAVYDIVCLRPHHALNMVDQLDQWKLFKAAADGTFPDPRTGKLKRLPFSCQEWDQIYGKYGAITEPHLLLQNSSKQLTQRLCATSTSSGWTICLLRSASQFISWVRDE